MVLRMLYGEPATVEVAAAKFRSMGYEYRDDLSTSFLVAGFDAQKGGQIYAVPIGGMITRRNMAAAGSGSSFITGYLDKEYKDGMSREEAIDFVLKGPVPFPLPSLRWTDPYAGRTRDEESVQG